LGGSYASFDRLWESRPDGLIVTGTEPRAAALADEPYWGTLTQIVDWAQYATKSAIWSCLSAHAAILHLDGIARHPLREKRSGVFECAPVADDPIIAAIPRRFWIPHSRCNDLDQNELTACGYTILSRSTHAGVDSFVKRMGSTFVFFQGHPEYEADSLLREYRRDIRRFVRKERETYPSMPEGYFGPEATGQLMAFRERALVAKTDTVMHDFPDLEGSIANTWRAAATNIYRNWLLSLANQERRMAWPAAPSPAISRGRTKLVASNPIGLQRLGLSPVVSARVSRVAARGSSAKRPADAPKA
jgi:homoserine O-succinyltransferase